MTLFQLDFFIFMLILMLVVGGLCVVISGLGFGKSEGAADDDSYNILNDRQGMSLSSVNEVDEAISELNDMSKNVFKEFEGKYQELLFLYNLIDEKEKRIGAMADGTTETAAEDKKMDINPKFANVLKMHSEGKGVEEIAKELDMGKGEITLILNLGGGRRNA